MFPKPTSLRLPWYDKEMTIFTTPATVRMYDTDAAGILLFANQFRFVQDAFEAFLESGGFPFSEMFSRSEVLFVVVSAKANYHAPLLVGDHLAIQVAVLKIGNTSFTMEYQLLRGDQIVGNAQITHVCINRENRSKTPIPEKFRGFLDAHVLDLFASTSR